MAIINIIFSKNIIFYFTIYLILPIYKSFKYFRAYNLLSGEILLITDEGIIKIDQTTAEQISLYSYNNADILTSKDDIKYISFAQSPLGNYLFCRIKQYIIILYSENGLANTIIQNEISEKFISILTYQNNNEENFLIICFINSNKELQIETYIDLLDQQNLNNKITKKIEYDDGSSEYSIDYGVSCEIMKDLNYQDDLLICFIQSESQFLTGLVFDPENDFSFKYLITGDEKLKNITLIKNAVSPDKTNFLICYEGATLSIFFGCITYNTVNKTWSKSYEFVGCSTGFDDDFEVYYLEDENEYFYYFPISEYQYNVFKLDNDFNIKDSNEKGKCYLFYEDGNFTEKYNTAILYNKNKYISLFSFYLDNYDNFMINEISTQCNKRIYFEGFNSLDHPMKSDLLVNSNIHDF